MAKTKIVLIGAGSAIFGVSTLTDLIGQRDHLHGSHLVLCDLDSAKLGRITRLAERLVRATGADFVVSSTRDYREALPGAEFVVTSVELDRVARWKLDWEIPFKYGIRHVLGENGGPGGLSHALRTIDLLLGIAQEVERLAPNAFLINFTNPLTRVCLALTRYTHVNVIGLCHQINKGYYIVGHGLGLAPRLDLHFPPPALVRELRTMFELRTAGLNHFTWIQSIRERGTGRELYPEFAERLAKLDPSFEPLSRRLYAAYGLFPASGDDHVGEYFAFAHETSDLKGYDYDRYASKAAELDAEVDRAATSSDALEGFLHWESGERGAHIIAGIVNDWGSTEEVVNLVNNGAVPGLPDWAVVEASATISAAGAQPERVPPFPPAITEVLNQQVAVQDRVVEAAVHGDRQAALEALLLDPVVGNVVRSADAEKLLDELLNVHADLLPRFRKQAGLNT